MHALASRRGFLLAAVSAPGAPAAPLAPAPVQAAPRPCKPEHPLVTLGRSQRRVLTSMLTEALYSDQPDSEHYADALQRSHAILLETIVRHADPDDVEQRRFVDDMNTERIFIESVVELKYAIDDDPHAAMYSRQAFGDKHVMTA